MDCIVIITRYVGGIKKKVGMLPQLDRQLRVDPSLRWDRQDCAVVP